MVRTSSRRRSGGVSHRTFSGRSVKGTMVSPCASAGSAHSGMPRTPSPANARLPLRMSRRELCIVIFGPFPQTTLNRPRQWHRFYDEQPRSATQFPSPQPRVLKFVCRRSLSHATLGQVVRYQHLQIAWMPVGVLGVAIVSAAAMAARASDNLMPALLISVFLLLPLLFVAVFTVTVTDDAIILRSGLGIFRTRIPVNAVRSCEPVPLRWYYGWDTESLPRG